MTTRTTTLTEFLLARIAEDERAALMAGAVRYDADLMAKGNPNLTAPHVAHIVRHGPAEVLAECGAKRRIVEEHPFIAGGPHQPEGCGTCMVETGFREFCEVPWPCPTLRLLALPYADHSEWREEWRP